MEGLTDLGSNLWRRRFGDVHINTIDFSNVLEPSDDTAIVVILKKSSWHTQYLG
jgi:hypothetical protein